MRLLISPFLFLWHVEVAEVTLQILRTSSFDKSLFSFKYVRYFLPATHLGFFNSHYGIGSVTGKVQDSFPKCFCFNNVFKKIGILL